MDQGNNVPYTHMDTHNLSPSSNSLFAEHVTIMNVPCVTWDATIDTVIANQAKAWAASRTNFGRNCDQNMDPKTMRRLMSRRIESKRSRLRKKVYMASLEVKAKEIEDEIVYNLRPQIESEQDQKTSLLSEKETIIHRINNLEKELLHKTGN
ncbi:putative transcription factor bZIP family [Medicago truncatula]|uniref:Putative transcription factor bZIP family n=1 Tax=Medicago truncatula TaxID=3880 RepID=A0A396IQ51_MEDTR|nr:putative transcription factor bZIP family [Medicago truncatula]